MTELIKIIGCLMIIWSLTKGSPLEERNSEVITDSRVTCGKRENEVRVKRVLGGSDAEDGEFPWIALLSLIYEGKEGYEKEMLCDASVIATDWILSAAHCFQQQLVLRGESYKFVRWTASLNFNEYRLRMSAGTQFRGSVHDVFLHPYYFKLHYSEFDAALLRVSEHIFGPRLVVPVCLPVSMDTKESVSGYPVITAGWGYIEDWKTPDRLQKAYSTGISSTDCKRMFPWRTITSNMMCSLHKASNTCVGDSGGPVVWQNSDGQYVQIGIVSFSAMKTGGECQPGYPSVLTFVPPIMDWIRNITSLDFD